MGAGLFSRLAGVLCLAAGLYAAPAAAQSADRPYPASSGPVSVGGDFTTTLSPPDHDAFFNYTNYDQNSLRGAQLRLVGEWRIAASLSFLGELRADNGAGVQAAAWYLRWHPSRTHALDIQVGRIPPVIGLFARQPYGRDNLQIGAPLAYQYLLSLRPDALPSTADDLIRMRGRGWEPSFPVGATNVAPGMPTISASKWDTGAEVHWHAGLIDAAGAVTRGAFAAPAAFDDRNTGSTWSGRLAVDAVPGLTIGVSGGRGPWANASALALESPSSRTANTQTVVGGDFSFGAGHWLVRGEELRSTFDVPLPGASIVAQPLHVTSGYLEGRYRFRPRWQVAGAVDYISFSTISGTLNGARPTTWDAPVQRVSANLGYRATSRIDVRIGWQMNWRDGGRVLARGYPALQLLAWF
jgi:hypothetical protein